MTTAWDQEQQQTEFMFTVEPGNQHYTFFYGRGEPERLCGFKSWLDGEDPELLGSAIPLAPIEIGNIAMLGLDTVTKDTELLTTPVVTYFGLAPPEYLL